MDTAEYLLNLFAPLFEGAICLEFGISGFQKRKFSWKFFCYFFVILFGIRGFVYSFFK